MQVRNLVLVLSFVLGLTVSQSFAADDAMKMEKKMGSSKMDQMGTGSAAKMGQAETKMDASKMGGMDENMMAKMKELSSPGENHKVLNAFVGKWKHTVKWWMDPKAPAEESTGTTETAWILGGRFLQQKTTGSMMGEAFEGMGLTGYDNVKKEYNTLWLDNMSTGMMVASSKYDPSTKTFSEKGSFSCPMTGGEQTYRAETKIVDADHLVYTMYGHGMDGKQPEFKTMEINYEKAQ